MSVVTLTGFMGTGKTSVGRHLAQRLHKPFIDTDVVIEQREGRSIAAIFDGSGEPYFRTVERQVLAEVLPQDAIIATGGGAVVDPVNEQRMHAAGPVVCLTAAVDVIMQRTVTDTNRPLLGVPERRVRAEQLLTQRAAAYARADFTVDTSQQSTEEVADAILAFLHRSPRDEVKR